MLGNVKELRVDNTNVMDSNSIKIKVESSNIQELEYNKLAQELKIMFVRGGIYLYKGVKVDLVVDLVTQAMNNGSVGKFFHQYIKQHECYKRI